MKMIRITPPPQVHEKNQYNPDIRAFLSDLRINILHISINEFIYNMDWGNEKYYQQIVNGYKQNGIKKHKNPTINHVFKGLNYAVNNFDTWKSKEQEIKDLIFKYIILF